MLYSELKRMNANRVFLFPTDPISLLNSVNDNSQKSSILDSVGKEIPLSPNEINGHFN